MRTHHRPTLALLAPLAALTLLACDNAEPAPNTPSGITTARPVATTTQPAPASTPTTTPQPPLPAASTPAPLHTAEPTELELHLAQLAGENPAVIAGGIEALMQQCTDTREALADNAERVWRILNEQRNIRAPVTAIISRVIVSLPIDGRRLACESLFASVITELSVR